MTIQTVGGSRLSEYAPPKHSVIEMIEVYDLPINSLSAIQEYNDRARAGKYDYGAVLRSLLGGEYQELENSDHARVQVGYVIQLAIQSHMSGQEIDPSKIYTEATSKAHDFVNEMSWVFAKKDEEVKLDAEGKPKQKKGAKQDQAYDVYVQAIKDGLSRKDIIQSFQDDVGMTKAGATTYFYNMKKKYEAAN